MIEIIGTTGTSYTSDIAIDEITVDVGTNSCASSCSTTSPCTENVVVVNMTDTWGDGWNGNTYTLTNSAGVVVATELFLQVQLVQIPGVYQMIVIQ